jgi:hypothetical protein
MSSFVSLLSLALNLVLLGIAYAQDIPFHFNGAFNE